MKSKHIILITIFVLLVFTLRINAASPNDTTTTLTVPTLDVGMQTTLSTITTYSGGNVFMGGVDYFALEDTTKLGYSKSSSTTSVSTPRITFTPPADLNFWIMRIPIQSIENLAQMDSDIGWAIKQGSSTIISGDFETNIVSQMLTNNGLLIVINSFQVSSSPKITLQAGIEYTIEINDNDGLSYTFASQTSGSPLLFDGVTSTGNSIQLVFYDGQHIGKVDTLDGTTAIQYTPSSSVNHIFAYYGYASGNFGSSFDFKTVTFNDDPDYTLTMSDVWGYQNDQISIQAILKENSIAKSSETVEFDLVMNGFYVSLGSDTTDGSGIASIIFTIDLDYGNYTLRARVQLSSSQIDIFANLEVKKTIGNFQNVFASGNFGSSTGNSSKILINGYLKTDGLAAIPDVVVEFWDTSTLLLSNTTTSTGYFEITYHQLLGVGTHSGYWLKSPVTDYDIPEYSFFIEIYQGQPQFELNTTSIETTYGENVGISGSVKDESGDPLTADIHLEKFDGSWIFVDAQYSVFSFEFSIETSVTGQHTLRVRFSSSDTDFTSSTEQISLQVEKADAIITPDQNIYDIEYNNYAQIIVDVTDADSNPLDGVDVSLYYVNFSDSSDFIHYQTITSSSGQVIFAFDPPSQYDSIPYFYYDLIVAAYSGTHNFTSATAKFQIITTDLVPIIRSTDYIYGKLSDVIFDTQDNGGSPGKQGEELLLYYNSQKFLSQIQADGSVSFQITFFEIGVVDVIVGFDNVTNYPYNTFNQTVSVNVDKAYHSISTQPSLGSQGETIKFTADIFDENNDPADVSTNFYIYTSDWQLIGTNGSVNGKFIYNYFTPSTLGIGTYQIKYEVPASTYYYLTDEITTLDITSILTKIEINGPLVYQYNSDIVERIYTATLSTMEDMGLGSRTLEINFGTYSTSVLTDGSGDASFSLPKLMTPGTYDLVVEYFGDSIYDQASKTESITVNGTDVAFDWISQPTDTKYGDFMTIELGLYDSYQYLDNKEISIYVDGVFVASKLTNSTGYVRFNIQMLFVDQDLTVEVRFEAIDGWNSYTESFDIVQGDKYLDAQSFTPDLTNVTYYDVLTQILLYAQYQNNPESGVTAELYLFDTSIGQFNLIFTGTTNSSGYLQATIDLPTQSVGTLYQLQWRMNQLFFQETVLVFDLPIEQETPQESVLVSSSVVMNDTAILFFIVDRDGVPIDDVNVNLVNAPLQVEYSETKEVINGQVTFIFIPQDSGEHILSYTVFDDNGNYAEVSGSIIFDVAKDDPNIVFRLRDEAGQAVLYLEIVGKASNRTITTSLTTQIDMQVKRTTSVTGLYKIEFSMNATQHRFEFLTSSTSQINSGYLSFFIMQEDISITVENNLLYAQVQNQLQIQVSSDNSTLEGHSLLLFVDSGGGWTQISTGSVQDGHTTFDISYLFDEGTYNLRINYPEQAWFSSQKIEFSVTVEKQTPSISFDYDAFIYNKKVNLTLYLNDQRNIGITSIQGSIVIYDGSWIDLYSGTLSHNSTYSLLIKQSLGEYNIKIFTLENEQYISNEIIQTVTVKQNTNLRVMYQTTAFYSDSNEVFLLLVEPETGEPVINQTISVYECSIFCSSKKFITSLQTNSSGIAVFNIPSNYIPNLYSFIAIYESSDDYSQSSVEFEVQVVPEQLIIIPTIIDYGITHNYTITIDVVDESGSVPENGMITVRIGDILYNYTYSGYAINMSYYDLVGDYQLVIDFIPDHSYYTFSAYSTNIGWDKIQHLNITWIEELGYGDDFTMLFESNGTKLNNLAVLLTFGSTIFRFYDLNTTMLTQYGLVSFVWLYPPSMYTVSITISNTTLFETTISLDYQFDLRVNKGDREFGIEIEPISEITSMLELNITDVVPESNYTIVVYKSNFTRVFFTQNSSIILKFSDFLDPGFYLVNVTRNHRHMHQVLIQSQFEIVPYQVDKLEINETMNYLYFSFDNYRSYYPVWIFLSISNGTHTLNFTITGLFMEHNFSHGIYQLFYNITGYYVGSGTIPITIPQPDSGTIENNSPINIGDGGLSGILSTIMVSGSVMGTIIWGVKQSWNKVRQEQDQVNEMPAPVDGQ